MTTLSICIPTYEMKGLGGTYLRQSFDILTQQTFKDFDIVVSDHSKDTVVETVCTEYAQKLRITYIKNTAHRGNSSANSNNAIHHAQGALLKILFQDDFLYDENSLATIVQNFDIEKDHWLVTACTHSRDGTHFFKNLYPKYNAKIHLGYNTIGSPSTLTIKNTHPLYFDENLIWLMDCEYYKRCYDTFGPPTISNTITVVNRIGSHQVSNTLATTSLRNHELLYVLQTYEHGLSFWYYRVYGLVKNFIKIFI